MRRPSSPCYATNQARIEAGALSGSRMSVVNHAELVSYYAKAGSDPAAIEAMLRALPIELVPVDRELATAAGLLRAVTVEVGLSLGDRFCLALAARAVASWAFLTARTSASPPPSSGTARPFLDSGPSWPRSAT